MRILKFYYTEVTTLETEASTNKFVCFVSLGSSTVPSCGYPAVQLFTILKLLATRMTRFTLSSPHESIPKFSFEIIEHGIVRLLGTHVDKV